jgi:hypothetical protein
VGFRFVIVFVIVKVRDPSSRREAGRSVPKAADLSIGNAELIAPPRNQGVLAALRVLVL